MEHCDLIELFDFLGKKWAFMVFSNIDENGKSFNELHNLMGKKINQTLLSERLKKMQEFGIVRKQDDYYHLTNSGRELKVILHRVKDWSITNTLVIPDKCHGKECVCHVIASNTLSIQH
ncbi:TPA: helix-turn-helix transcriptional regulator [Candidatus Woesearchaeota archaeon]|nr:hypothetical protein QT06_C0001G0918 [archaeon GW2011_AR15]MBS3104599.1 helix-turn-helix transcriptional regulator [Candidatus Woesearchaeota archaeon]HIH41086.1 helix-turn-helix transcriptional regulator [Candidatus Woesearchaeota archaeon]